MTPTADNANPIARVCREIRARSGLEAQIHQAWTIQAVAARDKELFIPPDLGTGYCCDHSAPQAVPRQAGGSLQAGSAAHGTAQGAGTPSGTPLPSWLGTSCQLTL